jgi:ABC-type lipoprotein export system ATPase subunit
MAERLLVAVNGLTRIYREGDHTQILERFTRKTGKSLVLATHSKPVSTLADRILTLTNGKIDDQSAEIV